MNEHETKEQEEGPVTKDNPVIHTLIAIHKSQSVHYRQRWLPGDEPPPLSAHTNNPSPTKIYAMSTCEMTLNDNVLEPVHESDVYRCPFDGMPFIIQILNLESFMLHKHEVSIEFEPAIYKSIIYMVIPVQLAGSFAAYIPLLTEGQQILIEHQEKFYRIIWVADDLCDSAYTTLVRFNRQNTLLMREYMTKARQLEFELSVQTKLYKEQKNQKGQEEQKGEVTMRNGNGDKKKTKKKKKTTVAEDVDTEEENDASRAYEACCTLRETMEDFKNEIQQFRVQWSQTLETVVYYMYGEARFSRIYEHSHELIMNPKFDLFYSVDKWTPIYVHYKKGHPPEKKGLMSHFAGSITDLPMMQQNSVIHDRPKTGQHGNNRSSSGSPSSDSVPSTHVPVRIHLLPSSGSSN